MLPRRRIHASRSEEVTMNWLPEVKAAFIEGEGAVSIIKYKDS